MTQPPQSLEDQALALLVRLQSTLEVNPGDESLEFARNAASEVLRHLHDPERG